MKQHLFFLAVFFHCLRLNAFEYPMLPNAILQSQTINSPIGSSLDCLLEKSLSKICMVTFDHSGLLKKLWYDQPSGTGFFISPQGHLLTSKHLIEGRCNPIIFLTFENRYVQASVIAQHPTEDVALLKIDDVDNLSFSYFDISSIPGEVGDWVFAPRVKGMCQSGANPLLILPSMGKIIGETNDSFTLIVSMRCIDKNSGSPILNLEGNVIGIIEGQAGIEGKGCGATLIVPVNKFEDWIREYLWL
jgi:S1-C subfamily serine protease